MPSVRRRAAGFLPLLFLPLAATGHGFLSTPRSRNLVAYEDRVYHGETSTDPFPEDCPSCINRGGTLARCGVLRPGGGDDPNYERNYDFPKNALGEAMPANPQQIYEENGIIEAEVVLTAHHKGHFVFKACPVPFTTISPTQECFDQHPLEFVSDEMYGAPKDENYPERAYVAPFHHPNKVTSNKEGMERAMVFKFKMQLPPGVTGDLVLIQWYYVASNSGCIHDGYAEYPWPEEWIWNLNEDDHISDWEHKVSVGTGLKSCEEAGVIPPDGDGVPEQFWNCAEVSIHPAGTLLAEAQAGDPSQNTGQLQSDKTIIGYFASWQWYDRNKLADPWVFDYRKYTRVNFAFFQTNEQGDMWGTDSWADPNLIFGPYNWNGVEGVDQEYCSWDLPNKKVCMFHHYEKGLMHLAKKAGAEVWPSIGGWSLSDPFSVMAENPEARARFASNCVELIQEYGFDGIDIDWEYPGYEAHSGRPEDTENYNLLLKDVREALDALGAQTGKFYGLTAALPCGTGHINNIDIPTAAKYLTELNLMTYDFFGAWSPTTGVNAPLWDQDWGGEDVARYSVDGCVKNWVEGGGSPSAVNIGLPFYGRGFEKAKHFNETHTGKPDKGTWWQDEGSPQYFNILNKLPDWVSVRHELTATQYAYNPAVVSGVEVGGMVSYDDEEAICDKTQYCLENQLNGFIIWEMSGDLMDDLSTPLIDAVHAKLRDPTLDCKKFAYDKNTFSGYATPLGNEIGASLALVTSDAEDGAIPEKEMTCPSPWFWGIVQWNFCKSYYSCTNGKPDESTLTFCDEGQLFDEGSGICKPASEVSCSEVVSPTASPISAEVALEKLVQEQEELSGYDSGFDYEPECHGEAGFKAGPGCTSYFRCQNGEVVSPILPCQAGTLFDESVQICNFEDSVECDITSHPVPASTPPPTGHPASSQPTQQPATDTPTRRPTSDPTEPIVHEVQMQSKPQIIPQTPGPTRNPTPGTSRNPTRWPSRHPVSAKPSQKPVQKVVFDSPTPYEVIDTGTAQLTMQKPSPTKAPTKKPQKRKTRSPTRPSLGGNTLASSFLNGVTSSSTFAQTPNKGQEPPGLGEKIIGQIQQSQMQTKKANKRGKRGKKKNGAKRGQSTLDVEKLMQEGQQNNQTKRGQQKAKRQKKKNAQKRQKMAQKRQKMKKMKLNNA